MKKCLAVLVCLAAGMAVAVESDSFKVDFGFKTGVVCEGWNIFGWSSGNVAGPLTNAYACANARIAAGEVFVSVTAGNGPEATTGVICARDRWDSTPDTTEFGMLAVYRDWINSNNTDMWITLDGLHPLTIYRFKAYAYDKNNTSTVTLRQWTDGKDSTVTAAIAYTAATEFTSGTSPDIYAAELELVTDKNGVAVVRLTGSPKAALISGFELMRGRDWDPFELLVDFGDSVAEKVYTGARAFYTSQTDEPRTFAYDGLTPNGSSGEVSVTFTLPESASGKYFLVRDRATNGFNAYEGVFPYYNLYRDLMIAQTGEVWIDVSGLTAGAKYRVVVCPFDFSYTRTCTLADWTSGDEVNKQTVVTQKFAEFTAETQRDTWAMTLKAKADADGHLKLRLTSNGETGIAWLELKYLQPTGMSILVR